MKKVVVVIPVYKAEPSSHEEKSWKRCLNILRNYSITVVTYSDLDLSWYRKNNNINFEFFHKDFFDSIQGYNRLMLSLDFYNRFRDYEYILIHQLDAFIFKDELDFWCSKGYDYVGAPWIPNVSISRLARIKTFLRVLLTVAIPVNTSYKVGNGGLSLRRVSSFIYVLNNVSSCTFNKYYLNNNKKVSDQTNEDVFYSIEIPKYFHWVVPTYQEALLFSIDGNPDHFPLTVSLPPFGCHGWSNKNSSFWEKYIVLYD